MFKYQDEMLHLSIYDDRIQSYNFRDSFVIVFLIILIVTKSRVRIIENAILGI